MKKKVQKNSKCSTRKENQQQTEEGKRGSQGREGVRRNGKVCV